MIASGAPTQLTGLPMTLMHKLTDLTPDSGALVRKQWMLSLVIGLKRIIGGSPGPPGY